MPAKVKNIKFTELPFETKDKNFQQCIEYIKLTGADYKKYIPKNPKQRLSFELENINADLANCIRRYLIDELPVYSMNVMEENIDSDDRYILVDYLRNNIEMIPFQQEITDKEADGFDISLHIENKTDDTIMVYSRDIQIHDKQKKILDNADYFTTTIPIVQLKAGKYLTIKNINVVKGVGKTHAAKFALLSNIEYEILDVKPLEVSKFNRTGESSLMSSPKHFAMALTTHRNINVKRVMPMCCEAIIKTLSGIRSALKPIKETDLVYFSDIIELETKGDVKLYHLKGEYWTIANIIARYCYLEHPDISFVCSSIVHPLTEESMVKIKHSETLKILDAAIEAIIDDITIIGKALS
jgi:DNA-directed RNA polymerase subunit L